MEKEPLACAVCLTRDRPEMLQRAIACFRAQTYGRRHLYIMDSGLTPATDSLPDRYPESNILYHHTHGGSIGHLRNYAANWQDDRLPDVFIHWDDDDWSHPERIAEQVALLKASGKEAVGYREMLFWDSRPGQFCAAWLFTSGLPRYCLGTSLCYWRSVWQKRPFEDVQIGEDYRWLQGVDSLGTSSMNLPEEHSHPRMIASIHGSNTSPVYKREYLEGSEAQRGEWKRAPAWDDFCRRTMEGECSSARP